jgi:hypothetical protein
MKPFNIPADRPFDQFMVLHFITQNKNSDLWIPAIFSCSHSQTKSPSTKLGLGMEAVEQI